MKILVLSSTIPLSTLETARNIIRAYCPGAEIELTAGKTIGQLSDVLSDGSREKTMLPDALIEVNCQGEGRSLELWADWYRLNEPIGLTVEPKYSVLITFSESMVIAEASAVDRQAPLVLILKHGVYSLLAKVTGRMLPWGILTGIRPSKLVHKMNDLAWNTSEQHRVLAQRYLIQPEKAELLLQIAQEQAPFLNDMKCYPEWVSVYIGIPFCPSRCSYCSFPGFALGNKGQELITYLSALEAEIEAVGALMKERGWVADNIYFGGGTPTILSAEQLERLLGHVHNNVPQSQAPEITVEGGRPETLSEEKLTVLWQNKVNRLSINPQTMNEGTLKRIGRNHSVADVYHSMEIARRLGSWTINMDLILGLPGEGLTELENTLKHIEKLNPDNLTVHVLALKKGSRAREENYRHTSTEIVEQMQALSKDKARAMGFKPYYLYRQKDIAANLENIGYAQPGHICRYNIAIMEERQTILGIGAGASSKLLVADDYSFVNLVHPSDWRMYVERWPETHQRRIKEGSIAQLLNS